MEYWGLIKKITIIMNTYRMQRTLPALNFLGDFGAAVLTETGVWEGGNVPGGLTETGVWEGGNVPGGLTETGVWEGGNVPGGLTETGVWEGSNVPGTLTETGVCEGGNVPGEPWAAAVINVPAAAQRFLQQHLDWRIISCQRIKNKEHGRIWNKRYLDINY